MPTGLLPKATKNYKPPTTDTTATTITPQQWACQQILEIGTACKSIQLSLQACMNQFLNHVGKNGTSKVVGYISGSMGPLSAHRTNAVFISELELQHRLATDGIR
jgi:hypothetical protein